MKTPIPLETPFEDFLDLLAENDPTARLTISQILRELRQEGVTLLFTLSDMLLHGPKITKGVKLCGGNVRAFCEKIKANDGIFLHEINRMQEEKAHLVVNNTLRVKAA